MYICVCVCVIKYILLNVLEDIYRKVAISN